jgi:hypothetical protein
MFIAILGTLALLAWSVASEGNCSRSKLQDVANKYLDEISQDGLNLTLADTIAYTENYKAMDIRAGFLERARATKFVHNRTLLDSPGCAIYVETISIATDNKTEYQIGTLIYPGDRATEIKTVIYVSPGGFKWWLKNILKEQEAGGRSFIVNAQRDSRSTLKQAADAFLDAYYNNGTLSNVPFAPGCTIMRAGYFADRCGLENPVQKNEYTTLLDREYVIDETVGTVEVFGKFKSWGGNAYDFRIEKGQIRYVHILSGGNTQLFGDSKPHDPQATGMAFLFGLVGLIGERGSRKGAGGRPKIWNRGEERGTKWN